MTQINLNVDNARFDKMRDAFIVPASNVEVAITSDALELYVNRPLDMSESLEVIANEKIAFSRMANSLMANEGVITITPYIVRQQEWSVAPHEEEL